MTFAFFHPLAPTFLFIITRMRSGIWCSNVTHSTQMQKNTPEMQHWRYCITWGNITHTHTHWHRSYCCSTASNQQIQNVLFCNHSDWQDWAVWWDRDWRQIQLYLWTWQRFRCGSDEETQNSVNLQAGRDL